MRQCVLNRVAGLLVTVLLAATLSAQGLYWESTHGKEPDVEKFYYMPKKFKVIGEDHVAIMRFDKEAMYVVNVNDKTYSEMTFAQMESMMKQAGSMMEQMREQLKDLPEEQRKMMEEMMGGKMGKKEPEVSVKNTGEKKTISGYSCTKYLLTRGSEEVGIVWATKDLQDFKAIVKDMEEFSKRMQAMNPMAESKVDMAFSKIEGFPMETELKGDQKMVVTKLEKRSVAASEFEVPSGYKKVPMPGMNHND